VNSLRYTWAQTSQLPCWKALIDVTRGRGRHSYVRRPRRPDAGNAKFGHRRQWVAACTRPAGRRAQGRQGQRPARLPRRRPSSEAHPHVFFVLCVYRQGTVPPPTVQCVAQARVDVTHILYARSRCAWADTPRTTKGCHV
jgi:hypothetical protein